MRRIKTIIAGALFMASLSSSAQDSDMEDRKFRVGLFGSPNFGWINPNIPEFDNSNLGPRIGFGYGLMLDYKFSQSPNYLFSTGFNITTNGGKLVEPWEQTEDINGVETSILGTLNRTYRLNYVNIPLLLKMRTNEIGYMSYFAAIGIDLGVRARAFADDEFVWQSGSTSVTEDINIADDINLFRTALNITGGTEYNLTGNTNVYVGLGWHNSFLNMFRNTDANRILEPDDDGYPQLDADGDVITSQNKKAITNYISLDIGIFF